MFSASKWKEASGQHVEYDQRPDIFRFVMLEQWSYMCSVIFRMAYKYWNFYFWQRNNKVCKCTCTFRSDWKSKGWSWVIGIHINISHKRKVALAGLSGESLACTLIFKCIFLSVFWSHIMLTTDIIVFAWNYRGITRVFLFVRKRWPPLQSWCAASVLPHSNSFLKLLQLWSLMKNRIMQSWYPSLKAWSSHACH